jgi:hypothetical protein
MHQSTLLRKVKSGPDSYQAADDAVTAEIDPVTARPEPLP